MAGNEPQFIEAMKERTGQKISDADECVTRWARSRGMSNRYGDGADLSRMFDFESSKVKYALFTLWKGPRRNTTRVVVNLEYIHSRPSFDSNLLREEIIHCMATATGIRFE